MLGRNFQQVQKAHKLISNKLHLKIVNKLRKNKGGMFSRQKTKIVMKKLNATLRIILFRNS